MPTWEFDKSLGDERRQALAAAPSFASIVAQIERDMTVLCCHRKECCDDQRFSRVEYCLQVDKHVFDLFFNSQNGYRGSYYESPSRGLEANWNFLKSILPKLIDWTQSNPDCNHSDFCKASVMKKSAKAWLAECGKDLCEECKGEWSPPKPGTGAEIWNDRWEKASSTEAHWGRRAPYLTKIRVFGGFLNVSCDEFIPAKKRHRAQQIHDCGWS